MFAAAMPTVSPLVAAWTSGTLTGLGMFAVVGAQSAFILRQGIARAHLSAILLVCALIDACFIFGSVSGLQALTAWLPGLAGAVQWCGVAFLSWYGVQSARRAWRPAAGPRADQAAVSSRRAALLGAVGFTLLNPHFWLDMMVLGSIAHGFADARFGFAAGALTASVLWLAALGLGSRLCAPLFRDPRAWRWLDGGIAAVMFLLAWRLLPL
ncbi:LysE/ArgO family amino acid transporter [Castellaniella defragrans]|uniref:Transporter, LysE family n=2 Tax=Castellaniella defragrans TaxID=75697 RepID=W8X183_CASD6|nr:LysE family transporter [Castellaniella defragrans]KAB0607410.1 lysine transporter LysE [Castellaniella defragrans]CDM25664.1 Transporter, LysE family [Castellaniella defragrans 65Phen]